MQPLFKPVINSLQSIPQTWQLLHQSLAWNTPGTANMAIASGERQNT